MSLCLLQPFVQGRDCARCREGHFYLEMDNPQGCLACFCSGITNQCSSSNYYREGVGALTWGGGNQCSSSNYYREGVGALTWGGAQPV
ncbi:hypothetical protein DPMN_129150 [Dreissena polymorpha]|uniref:Laminin EGF-like domain-containing protein n=1 Tax=Dreissena polymorpha TaxID=45954 RepID=A0A9D4H462_DREPO|nr:hypothetical protein DPMN_129150 [Dreissena polymorpha]